MGDSDITTCVTTNKHDDRPMTIFTEWLDTGLKIAIFLDSDSNPLVGEMGLEAIDDSAKQLSKTRAEYLDWTRQALLGRDENVRFVLEDSKFKLKQSFFSPVKISVDSVPLAEVFPNILKKFVLRNKELESSVERLEAEAAELRKSRKELEEMLEKMVELKNGLEMNLYSKFVVVLNSKKAKIRELQSKTNDNAKPKDEELFQAQTDDSEASEEEFAKSEHSSNKATNFRYSDEKKKHLVKRRIPSSEKMSDSDDEEDRSVKKNRSDKDILAKSNNVSASRSSNSVTNSRPSTSCNRDSDNFELELLDDCGESTKKSTNSSMLTSDESDRDMFL